MKAPWDDIELERVTIQVTPNGMKITGDRIKDHVLEDGTVEVQDDEGKFWVGELVA